MGQSNHAKLTSLDARAHGWVSWELPTFGQGGGPIWLDDVICSGFEERLIECFHPPLGVHNCVHNRDVGVTCTPRKGSELLSML